MSVADEFRDAGWMTAAAGASAGSEAEVLSRVSLSLSLPMPLPDADPKAPRFSDEQMTLILRRAAEMEAHADQPSRSGLSLAEIQDIAVAVGISRRDVAMAAADLVTQPQKNRLLGGPTRFRCARTISGQLSEEQVGELLDVVRAALGLQGEVKSATGEIEWRARTSSGVTIVNIAPRGEQTRISILAAREDGAAATVLTGGAIGLAAAIAVGIGASSLMHASGVIVVASGVAVGVPTFTLWTRSAWGRVKRQWTERIERLGDELEDRGIPKRL